MVRMILEDLVKLPVFLRLAKTWWVATGTSSFLWRAGQCWLLWTNMEPRCWLCPERVKSGWGPGSLGRTGHPAVRKHRGRPGGHTQAALATSSKDATTTTLLLTSCFLDWKPMAVGIMFHSSPYSWFLAPSQALRRPSGTFLHWSNKSCCQSLIISTTFPSKYPVRDALLSPKR